MIALMLINHTVENKDGDKFLIPNKATEFGHFRNNEGDRVTYLSGLTCEKA